MCEVSSNINPGALEYQLISFFHKNHLFNVIDTPGLDNSDSNNKNIEQIMIWDYQEVWRMLLLIIWTHSQQEILGNML